MEGGTRNQAARATKKKKKFVSQAGLLELHEVLYNEECRVYIVNESEKAPVWSILWWYGAGLAPAGRAWALGHGLRPAVGTRSSRGMSSEP